MNLASSSRPRVSVVMAVYNGEPFLRETLRSILDQSFTDFEYVVVDDGSTDSSRDIVRSFEDSRIRLVENDTNRGLSPSLNRGVREARGEFIARIDADDLALPQRLERQVAYLDAHQDIALVGSGFREIRNGKATGPKLYHPTDHVWLRWSLMFYCTFLHSAVMWRRRPVAEQVGPYDEDFAYAMDWEYWGRIGGHLGIANLKEVLAHYRLGSHSMTESHPHVAREVSDARRASIGSVFGQEEAEDWVSEGARLFPIIDGWAPSTTEDEIRESVRAIERLQAAFEKRIGLEGSSLEEFRESMPNWIARRLLYRARKAHRAGHRRLGTTLFREARNVDPGILASVDFARYVGARVLGPRLKNWPPKTGRWS